MEEIPLVMVREGLEDIPQYPLPAGYQVRLYRPGDKDTWVRLQRVSDSLSRADEVFERTFGDDLPGMERRCYFLVSPDASDVGTLTAWYERNYRGRRWGLIHWLAIVPEHRRKGLSKPIMTVAMNRLRQLGHRRGLLRTATGRIPAIKTYLDFGFAPDMSHPDAERGWKIVREVLTPPTLGRALR